MLYFEIPNFIIKRIYIVEENCKLVYKKLVDNKYVSLNEEELKEVKKYLNRNKSSIYYTEKLSSSAKDNNELSFMDNYLHQFLAYLNKTIPNNCLDNFYTNLQTLKINLNLQVLDEPITDEVKANINSSYDIENNSIFIDPNSIRQYRLIAQKTSNPDEFLWSNISHDLIHELFHMASSKNFGKGGFVCGFDRQPAIHTYEENRGLTEGFTEVLACACVPNAFEFSCNYFIEEMLVNQLLMTVGVQVVMESYFNNLGIKTIAEKLCEFDHDFDEALFLFELIEINFNLDKNSPSNILARIEMRLLYYFEAKIDTDILNNVKNEDIIKQIETYKSYLVTRDILEVRKENTPKYDGIEIVLDNFSQFEKDVRERLESRKV